MKQADYTKIALGMEQTPSFTEQQQIAMNERFASVVKGLIGHTNEIIIISGCEKTDNGSTIEVSEGVVFYQEQFHTLNAYSQAIELSKTLVFSDVSKDYYQQVWYGDQEKKDTFYENKITLTQADAGSGLGDFDKAKTLLTPDQINELVNTKMSIAQNGADINDKDAFRENIGVYSKDTSNNMFLQRDNLTDDHQTNDSTKVASTVALENLKQELVEGEQNIHSGNIGLYVPESLIHPLGRYVSSFRSSEIEGGQIYYPLVIYGYKNEVFVGSLNNTTLQVFDLNGNFLRTFGSDLEDIVGMQVYNDEMYVLTKRQPMKVFDLQGNYIRSFGDFYDPNNVSVVAYSFKIINDELFVNLTDTGYIDVFDLQGNLKRKFDVPNNSGREYNPIYGIEIFNDELYVNCFFEKTIKIFDLGGNHKRDIQIDSPSNSIVIYNNEIFLTNLSLDAVIVLDLEGNVKRTIGTNGDSNGQFKGIRAVEVYQDTIYVSDVSKNDIQILI